MKKYTKEFIQQRLAADQLWLEKAILAIYNKQTEDEKRTRQSNESNGIGFNSPDAPIMSYMAWWLSKGNHLSGKWKLIAWKKMPKYAAQLARIANGEV